MIEVIDEHSCNQRNEISPENSVYWIQKGDDGLCYMNLIGLNIRVEIIICPYCGIPL